MMSLQPIIFLPETLSAVIINAVDVDIELIETDEGWSPYLSLEDAQKLDDVRDSLLRGDIQSAGQLARLYTLTAVVV